MSKKSTAALTVVENTQSRAATAEPRTATGGALTPDAGGRTAGSNPATGTKLLPLGLHFDLDDELYHADPGLGSGDIRQLAKCPLTFWYNSAMNPLRPEQPEKDHFIYGRALHKLVLEGQEAFDERFLCGPDQTGFSTAEKAASTRATNAQAAAAGKLPLKRADYQRMLIAGAMITKNPHLRSVFTDGHPEVSLIWMRKGIRLKARFDYLKCTARSDGMVAANGDLKSVANEKGFPFHRACINAIASYGYHAQATHYLDGLHLVPGAIRAGVIHCHGEVVDDIWLSRFLDPKLRFGWQWVFFQKLGAPLVHSITVSPQNPLVASEGREIVERGLANYRQFMEEFGPNEPWVTAEEPREAMMEDMPGWL